MTPAERARRSRSWPAGTREHPIVVSKHQPNQDLLDPRLPPNRPIIMGWSARAASTLAITIFIRHLGRQYEAAGFSWPHKYRQEVLMKDGHLATPSDMLASANASFKFKVVRNPFSRAVSSYDHQMMTNFSSSPTVQAVMAGVLGTTDPTAVSFLQWLRAVDYVGMDKLDIHSKQQTSDFEADGFSYDYRCRVERLEECIDTVVERTGANFSMPPADWDQTHHDSPHTSYAGAGMGDVAMLPYGRFGTAGCTTSPNRRAIPEVGDFYQTGPRGREAMRLVAKLYAEDFDRYNYSTGEVPPRLPAMGARFRMPPCGEGEEYFGLSEPL